MLSQNSTAHIRRHGNDPVGFRQPLLSTGKYGPVDWEDPLDANRPTLLLQGALFVCKYVQLIEAAGHRVMVGGGH